MKPEISIGRKILRGLVPALLLALLCGPPAIHLFPLDGLLEAAPPAAPAVPRARPGKGSLPGRNPGLSRSLLEQSFHEDDVQALRTLVRSLKADPENIEATFRVAFLLQKMNRLSESTDYYERVLELSPCHEKSLNNLAGIRFRMKDMEGAEGYYRKSIECNGHFYLSRYNLGNILRMKGDLEGAAKAYEMALNLNERHYRSHTNLAIVLRELAGTTGTTTEKREFYRKEALVHATRACQIAPDDPINHTVRASALEDQGEWNGAIDELETAERLSAGDPAKRRAIGKRIERLRVIQKESGAGKEGESAGGKAEDQTR